MLRHAKNSTWNEDSSIVPLNTLVFNSSFLGFRVGSVYPARLPSKWVFSFSVVLRSPPPENLACELWPPKPPRPQPRKTFGKPPDPPPRRATAPQPQENKSLDHPRKTSPHRSHTGPTTRDVQTICLVTCTKTPVPHPSQGGYPTHIGLFGTKIGSLPPPLPRGESPRWDDSAKHPVML